MSESFHFLHPLWFLALLPMAALLLLLKQTANSQNSWRKVVDPQLLPWLMLGDNGRRSHTTLWLLGIAWLIAVLALADPTWKKLPQPVFKTTQARVIVLDLSRSMNASDIKPSRLFRARLKIQDILNNKEEGQTGLVVFAGDAFSVVPLTRDSKTIRSMLQVLNPDLMPVQGSRVDLGLEKAAQLLKQSGLPQGEILLIGDGMENDQAMVTAKALKAQGYRTSVLGVGTTEGAPVPDGNGANLMDRSGKPVLAHLNQQRLQQLAKLGGGRYATLQNGDQDLQQVLLQTSPAKSDNIDNNQTQTRWQEQGPLLILMLLPLAALAFRRGWLMAVLLSSFLLPLPRPATAATWNDLWQRPDQQATKAFNQGQMEQAAKLANDPLLRGSAEYRSKNYASALKDFNRVKGADANYNRGNTLAKLGKYPEAIAAYKKALQQSPRMADALANKAAIEKLLQQQKQQQQKKSSNKSGKNDKNKTGKTRTGENKQSKNSSGKADKNKDHKNTKDSQGAKPSDNNAFAKAAEKLKKQQKAAANQKKQSVRNKPETGNAKNTKRKKPSATQRKARTTTAKATDQKAKSLGSEEQLAAEQWLRRIPDDPGGLLRRKFLYQYQQRRASKPGQLW